MAVVAFALAPRKHEVRRRKLAAVVGKARPLPPLTARTAIRSELATVSHPTLPGFVERVYRVFDRVEILARQKKFGNEPVSAKRRGEAARIFLHCWEVDLASLGGSMDFDRVRGGGVPGAPPVEAQLEADKKLRQARNRLYKGHYRVIELVVCEGLAIADIARLMKERRPISSKDVDYAGFCFREGLDALADLWLSPVPSKGALRTHRPLDAIPAVSSEGEIEPARTAHASRDKVRYSDD